MWRMILPVIFSGLLLISCTTVPKEIRTPVDSPNLVLVQQHPNRYSGAAVRWGGTLAGVHNRQEFTELTIVSRRLSRQGRPIRGGYSKSRSKYTGGRFIARVAGFMEPVDLKKGTEITIVGTIMGTETRDIGEHSYSFPIVLASGHYLWEEYTVPQQYYYPVFFRYHHPYYEPFPFWYYPLRYYP